MKASKPAPKRDFGEEFPGKFPGGGRTTLMQRRGKLENKKETGPCCQVAERTGCRRKRKEVGSC